MKRYYNRSLYLQWEANFKVGLESINIDNVSYFLTINVLNIYQL